ncbi:GntT/GntP/DsdX family permease [Pseudokineococcus sp. 1T1Z-3]|uniref:GntT/GntP/DsdX family permease n=1 Tax=Pseudokineococcus sp. 1T1Z-3 TaxID=3132745 RepID=UPI0030991243
MGTGYLVGVAVAAIVLLLFLVMKVKIPAFVALLLVAVGTALATGIAPEEVVPLVVTGMGGTLGTVALLVGLGAMLGAIVEKTGGAGVLADALARRLGPERVGPALLLASAVVAVPIFFDVAFIILVPIVLSFAKAAGHRSPVLVGIPVAVLMVFLHNTVPPHPGVTGSSTLLGADIGLVTITALVIAIPVGVLCHYAGKLVTRPDFAIAARVREQYESLGPADGGSGAGGRGPGGGGTATGGPTTDSGVAVAERAGTTTTAGKDGGAVSQPSPLAVVLMVLVPVAMIATGTISAVTLPEDSAALPVISLVGAPAFALLVAVMLALYVLGVRHGWGREQMGEVMDASLAPAAIVVFVTGAGGVFARVLSETGLGDSISGALVGAGVPVLVLAFLLATVFKVAQGSGTVATLAAAGLLQSTVEGGGYSSFQVVLVVLAIACGSVALSHINDSGFWIVTRFLGLSVADGLRTWTVLATILGWSTFALLGLLWVVVS